MQLFLTRARLLNALPLGSAQPRSSDEVNGDTLDSKVGAQGDPNMIETCCQKDDFEIALLAISQKGAVLAKLC